jgi:predicted nucleic acid-binding protein
MAHRMKRVDEGELRRAVENFESLYRQLDLVEVTERLVRESGSLAEQFALRGYDAVHLASARLVQDPDLVLAAGDANLLCAAQALGIATARLTDRP